MINNKIYNFLHKDISHWEDWKIYLLGVSSIILHLVFVFGIFYSLATCKIKLFIIIIIFILALQFFGAIFGHTGEDQIDDKKS
jgi:hypothetical protein